MITIIHGDDIVSSRNYFKSIQKKDSVSFDGEKLTLAALEQSLQSSGLFEDETHIAIENLFSKRKPSKELDQIITTINSVQTQSTITLWEQKELTKKTIGQLSNVEVKLFTIPKSLFAFMDSIKPKNTKQMMQLYHQTLHHTEAEMILVMLIRQIRILLALSDDTAYDNIDEIKRMAPWQRKKLGTQSIQFSQEKLRQLHATLFDIEVKSKTGGLAVPLPQTIDFFLSTI